MAFDPIAEGAILRKKSSTAFDPIAEGAILRSKEPKRSAQELAEEYKLRNPHLFSPDIEGGIATRPQRTAAIETAAMAIPAFRASKYLPETSSWLTKALANYGGAIGQNAAIGAGTNALEGESPLSGAEGGGITTALAHPLLAASASGNPLTRAAALGILGGAGAYGAQKLAGTDSNSANALAGILSAGLGLRGKSARDAAILQHLSDVDINRAKPSLEAAERLGLSYITPAEATGSSILGAKQGSLGKTSEGEAKLFEKSSERLASEEKSINNLIKTIGTREELKPEIERLYKASYESSASPEFIQEIKKSPIIKRAFDEVKSNHTYKEFIGDSPEESFLFLDHVKQALDDMAEGAPKKEASRIGKKIKELTSEMDKINPTYAEARKTAQKAIITDKIQEIMDRKKVTGIRFFKQFLENNNTYKKMVRDLEQLPEAQQQFKDMKLAFEHLINPKTARAAAKLEETSMTKGRSGPEYISKLIHKLQGGQYDKAAVELVTNPKWADELSRIKDLDSNSAKTQAIANLLGRAMGTAVRQTANYRSENK